MAERMLSTSLRMHLMLGFQLYTRVSSVVLKLNLKTSSFEEMNLNLFKLLLRNPEKYSFLVIKLIFRKQLNCSL
jgi:hypothetical protein